MVTTLEALRAQEASLKAQEQQLVEEFRCLPNDGNLARRRDELRYKMEEVSAELTGLYPKVANAKQERKTARLADLLGSAEYRQAVASSLEGLVTLLGPWLGVLELTIEARRNALAVPLPPGTVSVLYNESKEWLNVLVRRGVIAAKDVPAPLRRLIGGGDG